MRLFFLVPLFFIEIQTFAQIPADSLMTNVQSELIREMAMLGKANQPPYYLAYRINDIRSVSIMSSFGSLVSNTTNHSRTMFTDLRVGDYDLDNTHANENLEEHDYDENASSNVSELPLENHTKAMQFVIWHETQDAYRRALEVFKKVKNNKIPEGATTTHTHDFSKEISSVHVDPPQKNVQEFIDQQEWTEKIKRITRSFLNTPEIIEGEASVQAGVERKYFLSSEGSRIAQNRTFVYLHISGSIRADDGDVVPLYQSYFAFDPEHLPSEEAMLQDVDKMIVKLKLLGKAPLAEPYSGPAILYARAAGVFFHEIFGHRVEGHRLKDKTDGQTFKDKLKEQVLPKTLSVVFDPTLQNFNGQALNGFYQYDDEGVMGQKVTVVEKGILKTFLMSRSPIENFPNSNGHGRGQANSETVSRQSNLIIENDKTVGMNDLRKMLVSECKKQKKAYGYLFMDVVGGFTTTQRYMPNAFNIFPTEVYRVYVDGRPDELVRGVDLIGTPLAMFAEITAADDNRQVFTGFCGAESGSVPVTAISPSLFVKRIETQRKPVTQVEKAILEKPYAK